MVFGLVLGTLVRRLTFSWEVACLVRRHNADHEIWEMELVVGPRLESACSGCLFGVVSVRRPGRLLRVAVTWEEALYLAGEDPVETERVVVACWMRRGRRVL